MFGVVACVLAVSAVLLGATAPGIAVAAHGGGGRGPRRAAEFFANGPRAHYSCAIYDRYHGTSEALCEDLGPGRVAHVTLNVEGEVITCASRSLATTKCPLGNAGERTPTFARGHRITIGRFRCEVLRAGVRCVVLATGKGFLFTARRTIAVGGAVARPQPLVLGEFLSPDRRVWCGLSVGSAFCATGVLDGKTSYPSALAQLEKGKVSICFVASESEAPLLQGTPVGCPQNWNARAPVLALGKQDEVDGVLCTSAADGVSCVETTGASRGKGFRVTAGEAVEVG
jgi:hypothetical protein